MSNDIARARSNYFHVHDADALRAALSAATPDLGVWTHGDGSDPTFVAVYSDEADTGSWPTSRYDEEQDDWIDLDLVALIAPHLRDGEVAVLMQAGFQKMRYVFGHALAFNNIGETRHVDLDDIYNLARIQASTSPRPPTDPATPNRVRPDGRLTQHRPARHQPAPLEDTMSTRYEYVPATASVDYVPETDLPVESPVKRFVLVLAYDEAVVIDGSPAEIADLLDRIAATVGLRSDTWSSKSQAHHEATGRYQLYHG